MLALAASEDAFVGHSSTYFFGYDAYKCDTTTYTPAWLPTETERESWGSISENTRQWGWSSNIKSGRPIPYAQGSVFSIIDGSETTKFEWSHPSFNDGCILGDENCQTFTYLNETISAYNQLEGGRKCFGCTAGDDNTCSDANSASPSCADSLCARCNNLKNWVAFDAQTIISADDARVYVNNSPASARLLSVYYSLDSIMGPWSEWINYEAENQDAGWKVFSDKNTVTPIYGRYFKIVVQSNWGNPIKTELVEFQIHGYKLNEASLTENDQIRWVDSESGCSKSDSVVASRWTFGFADEDSKQYTLQSSSFVLEIDHHSDLLSYTVSASEVAALFKKYGYQVLVDSYEFAKETKYGNLWNILFTNTIPEYINIRYRIIDVNVPAGHICFTECNLLPSSVYIMDSLQSVATIPFYPCVSNNQHMVLSNFVYGHQSASLCINNDKTDNTIPIYSINTISPLSGPAGGIQTVQIDGLLPTSMKLGLFKSGLTSSAQCNFENTIVSPVAINEYSANLGPLLVLQSSYQDASICLVFPNNNAILLQPTFTIKTASIESLEFVDNIPLGVVGDETEVYIHGIGFGKGDSLKLVSGSCDEIGDIYASSTISTFTDTKATAVFTFTTPYNDLHFVYYFQNICIDIEQTFSIKAIEVDASYLYMSVPMIFTITGYGFTNQDKISFADDSFTVVDSVSTLLSANNTMISFKLTMGATYNSNPLNLLYYFGGIHGFKVPNKHFILSGIRQVNVIQDNIAMPFVDAIEDIPYTIQLSGIGFELQDEISYSLDDLCQTRLPVTMETTIDSSFSFGQTWLGHITFADPGVYHLCYYIHATSSLYTTTAFDVVLAGVVSTQTSTTDNILVEGMNYYMRFNGFGIYQPNVDYKTLTPNTDLTGGICNTDACPELSKYYHNKYPGSPYPSVTVDGNSNDKVFVFSNAGYTWGLNNWIIYDFGSCHTLSQFNIFINGFYTFSNARDIKLQYLDSCNTEDCAFKPNAPWKDIPETILYNLDQDETKSGIWKKIPFNTPVASRYFRFIITRNWGNTEFTILSEVEFIGSACSTLSSTANTVRLVENTCDDESTIFSVGDSSHASYINTNSKNSVKVCYDLSNPDMTTSPKLYDNLSYEVAHLDSVSPSLAAADSIIDLHLNGQSIKEGDKIFLVDSESTSDSDCWNYYSQSTTGKQEKQTIILEFNEEPTTGSFIVSDGISQTIPIDIQDTLVDARLKIEHLSSIDDAIVTFETAQQPSGKWNTILGITILSPAGSHNALSVILPSEECSMCYRPTCSNASFHYEAMYNILEIKGSCTFGNIDIGHRIEIIDENNVAYYFDIYGYLIDNSGIQTDTERVFVIPTVTSDSFDIIESKEAKACPKQYKCTSFSTSVQSVTVNKDQTGNNPMAIVQSINNQYVARVHITSSTASAAICYKFGEHPWKLYKDMLIETPYIKSLTPSSFIAGVESTASIQGVGNFEQGSIRFLMSGEDCNTNPDAYAKFMDGSDSVVITDNMITIQFQTGFGGNNWSLCYKSKDQIDYILLSNIVIKVSFISTFTSVIDTMSNDYIVATVPKSFTLSGYGFTNEDTYKWIDTSMECTADVTYAPSVKDIMINNDLTSIQAIYTFDEHEQPLSLCYHFNGVEGYLKTSIVLNVVYITAVTPSTVTYNGQSTKIIYTGHWYANYVDTDNASWINTKETIQTPIDVIQGEYSSTIKFNKLGQYSLTYTFGNETPKDYQFIIESLKVDSLTPSMVVAGCMTKFILNAYNYDEERNDKVAFVLSGHQCTETDYYLKLSTEDNLNSVYAIDDTHIGSDIVIDSQAVAGTYSLCYAYSTDNIASYATITIEIKSFNGLSTSTSGLYNVLVADISEEVNILGNGISAEDSIRFIPMTNTDSQCLVNGSTDTECDSPYEDRTFPITSDLKANLYFKNSLVGNLQVCYKFKDLDYWVKTSISVTLGDIDSIDSDFGSNDVVVAGYPKVFTFNGIGIHENDKFFYMPKSISECNIDQAIYGPLSINSNHEAPISFAHGLTEELVLCYQFSNEHYKLYSSYTLKVYELTSFDSINSALESNIAIVGTKKQFKVNGLGISDKTLDMARWVSGNDCNINIATLNNADYIENSDNLSLLEVNKQETEDHFTVKSDSTPILSALQKTHTGRDSMYVAADNTIRFEFASGLTAHQYNLCYKFGDEPYLLYPSINVNIWDLTDVTSYTDYPNDLPNVVIAGTDSPIQFTGNGISSEDTVFFIHSDDTCRVEYAITNFNHTNVSNLDENNQIIFNFEATYSSITICYQFKNEGYIKYPQFTFKVFSIDTFSTLEDNQVFILNADSTIKFTGNGVSESNVNDKFRFIGGEDCSNLEDALGMKVDGSNDIVYEASVINGMSQVKFVDAGWFSLCYTFGNEEMMYYPRKKLYVRSIIALKAYDSQEGADGIIVKNQFKKFEVYGNITLGDSLKFVSGNDCSVSGANIQVNGEFIVTDSVEVNQNVEEDKYYIDFLLLESSSEPLLMCYHPSSLSSYIPTSVYLTVLSLDEVTSMTGNINTIVAKYPKTYIFNSNKNNGVTVGDQVTISKTNCNSNNFLVPVVTLDDTFEATFMLDNGSNDAYVLCYKFASEKWLASLDIHVNEIKAVVSENCPTCTSSKSSAYNTDVYIFTGFGISSGSSLDQVKWVKGTDCNSDAVAISESSLENSGFINSEIAINTEGSIVEVSSTPIINKLSTASIATFTSAVDSNGKSTITFLETSKTATNNKFSLCYRFADEPFVFYQDITTTVIGIDTIDSNKGSSLVYVANVPENLIISGYGLSTNDQLKFVSGNDCDADIVLETSIYSVSYFSDMTEVIFENIMFTVASNGYYSLCYKYGSDEQFSLVTKYQVEVYDINSSDSSIAVAGVEKQIQFTGYGIHLGDFIRYVPSTSTSCDNANEALVSNGMTDINVDEGGHAIVTFDHVTTNTYVLCYRFVDEPYKMYSSIQMTVATLNGNNDNGRRLQDTTYDMNSSYDIFINGYHISKLDTVVPVVNVEDCKNIENPLSIQEINKNQYAFKFNPSQAGLYHLCYMFNTLSTVESFFMNNFQLAVRGISKIEAIEGSNTILVNSIPKTFIIEGIDISNQDSIALTQSDNCNNEQDFVYVSSIDEKKQFTLSLNLPENTKLSYCYKSSKDEQYKLLSYIPSITMVNMNAATYTSINDSFSIKLSSHNIQKNDLYAFTSSNNKNCNRDSLIHFATHSPSEQGISGSMISSLDNHYYAKSTKGIQFTEHSNTKLYNIMVQLKDSYIADNVSESSINDNDSTIEPIIESQEEMNLCYQYNDDIMNKMDIQLTNYQVDTIIPNRAQNNQASKLILTIKPEIPKQYYIKFVENGQTCSSTSTLLFDNKSILSKSELDSIYTIHKINENSSNEYSLCLSLNTIDWTLHSSITMNIIEINMEPIESMIAGISTPIIFNTLKNIHNDDVFYLNNKQCNFDNDMYKLMISGSDNTYTMRILSNTMSIIPKQGASSVYICANIKNVGIITLQSKPIIISQFISMEGVNIPLNELSIQEKTISIYGNNLENSKFWFISSKEECSNTKAMLPIVNSNNNIFEYNSNKQGTFTFITEYTGITEFVLCYQYSNGIINKYSQYTINSNKLNTIFKMSKMMKRFLQETEGDLNVNSLTTTDGSINTFVIGNPKKIYVTGTGLTNSDIVYYVDDITCESDKKIYTTSVVSNEDGLYYELNINSIYQGTFLFCYQFSDATIKPYSLYSITTKTFTGLTMNNESINKFVVSQSHDYQVIGNGFAINDKIKFIPEGSTCDNMDILLNNNDNYLDILSLDSINIQINSKIASIQACYKFGSESYVLLSEVYTVYSILSIESENNLINSVAVVDQPKLLHFTTTPDSINGSFYFVSSDSIDCSGTIVNGPYTLENNEAIITFMTPSIDTYQICFLFNNEQPILLGPHGDNLISIAVYQFNDITLDNDVITAVNHMSKTFSIDSIGSSMNDNAYLVISSCEDEEHIADITSITDHSMDITFNKVIDSSVFLCYQFNGAKVQLLNEYNTTIYEVYSMTGVQGTILGDIKTHEQSYVQFTGNGIQEGDRIKFIDNTSTNCEDSNTILTEPYVDIDNNLIAMFVLRQSGSKYYKLCYQFEGEEWKLYDGDNFSIHVENSPILTDSKETSNNVFILNERKTLLISGGLASINDKIKIVETEDCNSNVIFAEKSVIMNSDNHLSATYIFTNEDMLDKQYYICYQYPNSDYFPLYPITIKGLLPVEITVSEGNPTTVVAGQEKTFTFYGNSITDGDKIKFVVSSCTESTYEFIITNHTVTVVYPTSVSQSLKLCYLFGGESWKMYNDFSISIDGINTFEGTNNYNINYPVINDETIVLNVVGNGVSNNDYAYIIESGEEFNKKITYPMSSLQAGHIYDICYVFVKDSVKEAPIILENLRFTPLATPTLTSSDGYSGFSALVGVTKTVVLVKKSVGFRRLLDDVTLMNGATAGDKIKFVLENEGCNGNSVGFNTIDSITVEENAESLYATYTLDYSTSDYWNVCYQFSKYQPNQWYKLSDVFTSKRVDSLVAIQGNSNYVIYNVPKTFTISGTHISVEDQVAVVPLHNSCERAIYTNVNSDMSVTITLNEINIDQYQVCYKMVGENVFVIPDDILHVYYVKSLLITPGTRNDAVVYSQDSTIEFIGSNLNTNDRVVLIDNRDSCTNSMTLYALENNKYSQNINIYTTKVAICYKFDNEEVVKLHITLDVLYIDSMELSIGSTSLKLAYEDIFSIVGIPSTIKFYSLVSTEGDSFKWVSNNAVDCSGISEGFNDETTLINVDTNGVATFTFEKTSNTPYQLCYKFNNKEFVLLGYNQNTFIGSQPYLMQSKGITNIQAEQEDHIFNKILINNNKTITITGTGLLSEDIVAISENNECTQIIHTFEYDNGIHLLEFNSLYTSPLYFCYGFTYSVTNAEEIHKDHLYVSYNTPFEVYGIENVTSSQSSIVLKHDTITLTFNGYGISNEDQIYFVPSIDECTSIQNMDSVELFNIVDNKATVSFNNYNYPMAYLCYIFKDEDKHIHLDINNNELYYTTIFTVNTIVSTEGYNNYVIVSNLPKQFTITGDHVESISSVYFVDTESCDDINKITDSISIINGVFTVSITNETTDKSKIYACFVIDEQVYFHNTAFDVYSIQSITSEDILKNYIIADQMKTISITGNGISDNDNLVFIGATNNLNKVNKNTYEVTVPRSIDGDSIYIEYQFANEGIAQYTSHSLLIVDLINVMVAPPNYGNDKTAYVNYPKSFIYVNNRDIYEFSIKYILGNDCTSSPVNMNDVITSQDSIISLSFTASTTTGIPLNLCYAYKIEQSMEMTNYILYSEYTMRVVSVNSVTAVDGIEQLAIVNEPKAYLVGVNGWDASDSFWFSTVKCQGTVTDALPYGVTPLNYIFNKAGIYHACYMFKGEAPIDIISTSITVASLNSLKSTLTTTKNNIIYVEDTKRFEINGDYLDNSDSLSLSTTTSCRNLLPFTIVDNKYVDVMVSTIGRYYVCYNYRNTYTIGYSNIYIDIVSIQVDEISGVADELILNSDKYITVSGYGLSTHDIAYLVKGTDCSTTAIQQYHPMNLDTIVIQYPGSETSISLCYQFTNGYTPKETQIFLATFNVFSISISGLPDYFVAEKSYTLTFGQSEENDIVYFVPSTSSCASDIIYAPTSVINKEAVITFTQPSSNGIVRPCYIYSNTTKLYDFGMKSQRVLLSAIINNNPSYVMNNEQVTLTIVASPNTIYNYDKFTFVSKSQQCSDVIIDDYTIVMATNTYTFDINKGYDFNLCYYFSQYKEIYEFTSQHLIISDIESINCSDSDCFTASTFVEKTITFNSQSIEEGQHVKFVIDNCDEEPFGMESTLVVDNNNQMHAIFNTVHTTPLRVCYAFIPEQYYLLPETLITMSVYGINSEETMKHMTNDYIIYQSKPIELSIISSESYPIETISLLFTTSLDCSSNDNSILVPLTNNKGTIQFNNVDSYHMCLTAKYNNIEKTSIISSMIPMIHSITSFAAEEGNTNIIIGDIAKVYTLEGQSIIDNDEIYLSTSVNCEESTWCIGYSILSNKVSLSVPRTYVGGQVFVSYKCRNEDIIPLHSILVKDSTTPATISVYGLSSIIGHDNIISNSNINIKASVGYDTSITLLLTTEGDYTCSNPATIENNPIELVGDETSCHIDANTNINTCDRMKTILFKSTSTSNKYVFCIKYGIEDKYYYYGTPVVTEASAVYGYVKSFVNIHASDSTTSDSIVIAEQSKLFTVEVNGWNVLDELYWIPDTLSCNNDLSTIIVSSKTSGINQFNVIIAKEYAGMNLSLCYRYVGGIYRHYPEVQIAVASVNSIEFQDGNNVVSINSSKNIKIDTTEYPNSTGINKFKFVYESCDEDMTIYTAVNYDWTIYTLDKKSSTKNSMELFLCYQFNTESFYAYPSMTISLVGIKGITASTGSNTIIVANTEKEFNLVCTGCSVSDKVSFVSDINECSNDSSISKLDIYKTSKGYAFSYSSSRPQSTYYMCYYFYDNTLTTYTPTYYENIQLTVSSVNLPRSATSSTISIVGEDNFLDFSSSVGLSGGDQISYVPLHTNCEVTSTIYPIFTLDDNLLVKAHFTRSTNNDNYYLCYYYATENVMKKYDNIYMLAATIDKVTSTTGNSNAILNVPKVISFSGSGIRSGDRVMYIRLGAECDTATEDQILASAFITYSSISITFTTASDSYLCYKFSEQKWMKYTQFTMSVDNIEAIALDGYGNINTAVVGLVKRIGFNVVGDYSNSYIKFVRSTDSCESNPIGLMNSQSSIVPMQIIDDLLYIEFTFKENINNEYAKICILHNEVWFGLTQPLISIYDITSINPSVYLPNEQVTATISGYGIQSTDKIYYIPYTSTCDDTVEDDTYIKQNVINNEFTFVLSESVLKYRVCYQFTNEKWIDLSEINNNLVLFIGSISSVSINQVGSEDKSLLINQSYTLYIQGYGLSATDTIKIVPYNSQSDCTNGLIFSDNSDILSLTIVNNDLAMSIFTISSNVISSKYMICYNFHESVYHPQTNFVFDIYTINTMSVPHGSINTIVINQPKEYTFTGMNINNNDVVFLSNPNSECVELEGTSAIVNNNKATLNIQSILPYNSVAMCYKFVNINKIIRINTLSVYYISSMTNSFNNNNMFFAETQYTYTVAGHGITSKDSVKFVKTSGTCNDEPLGMDSTISVSSIKEIIFTFNHINDLTETIHMCYKFNSEEWIQLSTEYKFIEITINSDDKKSFFAVLNTPKMIRFESTFIGETDTYKWIDNNNNNSPICADDASDAQGFTSEQSIRSITKETESTYVDTFTLESGSQNTWSICWKFTGTDKYYNINYIQLSSTQVNELAPSSDGSHTIQIKNVPKSYSLKGYGTKNANTVYVMKQNTNSCQVSDDTIVGSFPVNDSQVEVTLSGEDN
ncbi:hypothetical protein WA158_004086 [Blastocystis sp. Blastoise]